MIKAQNHSNINYIFYLINLKHKDIKKKNLYETYFYLLVLKYIKQ